MSEKLNIRNKTSEIFRFFFSNKVFIMFFKKKCGHNESWLKSQTASSLFSVSQESENSAGGENEPTSGGRGAGVGGGGGGVRGKSPDFGLICKSSVRAAG